MCNASGTIFVRGEEIKLGGNTINAFVVVVTINMKNSTLFGTDVLKRRLKNTLKTLSGREA